MPEPRGAEFHEPEERCNHYTGALPTIGATVILARQSGKDTDTAHSESRKNQLRLQDYVKLLYGSNKPNIPLYID